MDPWVALTRAPSLDVKVHNRRGVCVSLPLGVFVAYNTFLRRLEMYSLTSGQQLRVTPPLEFPVSSDVNMCMTPNHTAVLLSDSQENRVLQVDITSGKSCGVVERCFGIPSGPRIVSVDSQVDVLLAFRCFNTLTVLSWLDGSVLHHVAFDKYCCGARLLLNGKGLLLSEIYGVAVTTLSGVVVSRMPTECVMPYCLQSVVEPGQFLGLSMERTKLDFQWSEEIYPGLAHSSPSSMLGGHPGRIFRKFDDSGYLPDGGFVTSCATGRGTESRVCIMPGLHMRVSWLWYCAVLQI